MGRWKGSLLAIAALAGVLAPGSDAGARSAAAPAENAAPTADNAVLLTVFFRHDQSRPLSELNRILENTASGNYRTGFYPTYTTRQSASPRTRRRNRRRRLHHRVVRNRLAEPGRAELRRPLLRLEVDIDEAEPGGKTVAPFEIIHQAPVKVALDGHPFRGRPAQMPEVVAQEHDPVGIVDNTACGHFVLAPQPFSAM